MIPLMCKLNAALWFYGQKFTSISVHFLCLSPNIWTNILKNIQPTSALFGCDGSHFKIRYEIYSSIASPICQEGQSERTFPIFAFSCRFFLFFPIIPDFPPLFPDFWHFFHCQGWHSAPLTPQWLHHLRVRGGNLPPLAPPVATPLEIYFL